MLIFRLVASSRSRFIIYAIISCCILCASSFRFRISDSEPLLHQVAWAPLDVELFLVSSESFLLYGQLCMSINTTICHCYDDSIDSLHIFLPPSCALPPPYYLSFVINVDDISVVSAPLQIVRYPPSQSLTLVLPLTLNDIARCSLLFLSLHSVDTSLVAELIIITPDMQLPVVSSMLSSHFLPFRVRFIPESLLFRDYLSLSAYPYAIQMALKLLVSHVVSTPFYITLDADVIFLHNLTSLITNNRAIYQHEDQAVHPGWWLGSQQLLQLPASDASSGISVTPVIMSTFGSLLTLRRMEDLYGETYELLWLNCFGQVLWSEYTMYRLALDYYKVVLV